MAADGQPMPPQPATEALQVARVVASHRSPSVSLGRRPGIIAGPGILWLAVVLIFAHFVPTGRSSQASQDDPRSLLPFDQWSALPEAFKLMRRLHTEAELTDLVRAFNRDRPGTAAGNERALAVMERDWQRVHASRPN